MGEGKPYRCGLMAAGLGVMALGLFIMVEEKPHVYGTMCALGLVLLCAGTVWSFCQCYPKVVLVPRLTEKTSEEEAGAADGQDRLADPQSTFLEQKCESSGDQPQSQSCPTLHLV